MGAGRNSTTSNTQTTSLVNPYDPNTQHLDFLDFESKKTTQPIVAPDNPTATGTKTGSFYDYFSLILGSAAPTIESVTNLKLAQQGLVRGTTASEFDVKMAEAQARAEIAAAQKAAQDAGGAKNNNTLLYVGGGLLFLGLVYLILKATKKP